MISRFDLGVQVIGSALVLALGAVLWRVFRFIKHIEGDETTRPPTPSRRDR